MAENRKKNTGSSKINKQPVYKTSTSTKKTKKSNNNNQKSKIKKIVIRVLIGLLIIFLVAAGIIAGIIFGMFQKYSIPIDKLKASSENTIILDTDGNIIATLNGDEKRDSITLEDMAKYLPTAFIAIEDERFYEHQGIDIKRTAAATFSYIFKGNSSFGGSTITQQLVKNITKEDERDAARKIKEMARAYNLEKTLTKDEILTLYLNMIFMGENVYGVQMGAKLYFDKNASELDLAECAFLAGINNSPNSYNAFSEDEEMKEKIKTRTLTVINKMHDLGKIESDEVYNEAVEKVQNGLTFTKGNISSNVYSYHTDALIEQIIEQVQEENPDMTRNAAEYYVYNGGLVIYSTQNTAIQTAMEEVYNSGKYLIKSSKNYKKDENGEYTNEKATTQSAMVIIDNATGQVVATVGGFGEKTARGLNRATQTLKQPGSSIKPLAVIAPSLEAGLITAGTVIDDTSMGSWPNNDDHTFRGLLTVRTIIKLSRNVPEVKMMNTLGTANSAEFLTKLGISTLTEEDYSNPAMALGGVTDGISPLEMAAAYATIANDGVYIEPTFYTKVEDVDGNIVLEAKQETRTVMSADNAYILKSILRGPLESGGTAASYGVKIPNMDTCGKTGTNDYWERWFCGFTPYYTAATWYGFDESEYVSSTNNAAIIWGIVMKQAHQGLEGKTFQRTANIVTATICNKSGLLATDLCKEAGCAYLEEFVKGTVPTKSCETHVKALVCVGEDGVTRLATENCPNAEEKIFITRPNSDQNTAWKSAADANLMLPTETCEEHTQAVEPSPSPETSPSPNTSTTPSPNSVASPTNSPESSVTPTSSTSPTPTPTPTSEASPDTESNNASGTSSGGTT